jgi:tetratricopeptide (TPR) repeat protein
MSAAASCVLGDVELREGRDEAALAAYRRAWQTAQEHTRLVAHRRISARARAGLASAYWASGERERARELLDQAAEMALEDVSVAHASAAASLSELFLTLATGFSLTEQPKRAIEMVERAVRGGWRDAAWLRSDPLLQALRGAAAFQACVAGIESKTAIRWDEVSPRLTVGHRGDVAELGKGISDAQTAVRTSMVTVPNVSPVPTSNK